MTGCCVKGCHSASEKHKKCDAITFHQFPVDPVIANRWTEIVRRNRKENSWKPSKNTKICSKHFRRKDKYLTNKGMQKIHRGAVPTKRLFLRFVPSESDSENTENSENPQNDIELSVEKISTEIYIDSRPSTSTGQPSKVTTISKPEHVKITNADVADENKTADVVTEKTFHEDPEPNMDSLDLDSILDTPQSLRLHRDLRRKTALQIKNVRLIRTLKQKNRRLKKQNASLKQIVLTLKKKPFNDNDVAKILSKNVFAADLYSSLCKELA